MTRTLCLLLLTSTALLGCAVSQVDDHRRAYAAAKPCCASVADLPPAQPAFDEQAIALTAAAPHFDFGLGLAPFARVQVDAAAMPILETQALAQASPRLGGGDGTLHFPAVRLLFYDAQARPLPHEPTLPPSFTTVGWSGHYALATNVRVPAGATLVVVTTDPIASGLQGASPYRSPDGGMMVGSTYVPLPGGPRTMVHTLVPYGNVVLRAPGAPRRLAERPTSGASK